MITTILFCILAAIVGLVTDWVWAHWMQHVNERNPIYAANWSFTVHVIGFISTLLLIEGAWIPLIFYLVGSWFGTYLAVRKHRRVV